MLEFSESNTQVALSVGGHDPSSGAGVTADLQTFAAHGLFGTSVVTAHTVQSTLGVAEIAAVDAALLRRTLDHLCADLPPAGIKIGMLGSAEIASAVAGFLTSRCYEQRIPVVLDPILRASSGAALLPAAALATLHEVLLPHITCITPNWAELAALAGAESIRTPAAAEMAMERLAASYPQLMVVATGGDQAEPVDLLRLPSGEFHTFHGTHIASTSTHGTGCAFSSALLARLLQGDSAVDSVAMAKAFVVEAIRRAPAVGQGRGPLNLLWPLKG